MLKKLRRPSHEQKRALRDAGRNPRELPQTYMVLLKPSGEIADILSTAQEVPADSYASWRAKESTQMCTKHEGVFLKNPPPGVPPERFPGASLKLDIDLDNQPPPAKRVLRLSESQLTELRVQLEYYIERGWLRPSNSPYATPVFFAAKPHTSPVKWRMCCDYRLLNKVTRRDAYPLPPVDVLIDRLRGAKIFSKIDLTQYFHQIPMHPESIAATAITTRYGNYEWTVVPFGLANALAVAQRMANILFQDFIDDFVVIFMDDILVFSDSIEAHERHLNQLFERMKEHKLYAHPDKCELYA